MKKRLCCLVGLLYLFACNGLFAQTGKVKNDDQPLPLDPQLRYGKLPNGLTYYIRRWNTQKNDVHLKLVVKAGKEQEDADQLELSHLLEHMAFVKTTHFPDFKAFLDKEGIHFGNGANASNISKFTDYRISIPADKQERVQKGLQWLRDIAQGGIILEPAKIDNERGVVMGEIRGNRGASLDMSNVWMKKLLGPSKYTERLIADTRENVLNFQPSSLLRFYNDWYRPDLEAIIVTGDINVDDMEQQIKKLFADLTVPENPRPLEEVSPLSLNGRSQVIIVTHPDASELEYKMILKQPYKKLVSRNDFRASMVNELCSEMLTSRLMLLRENGASFKSASFSCQSLYLSAGNPFGALIMSVRPGNKSMKADFFTVLQEVERLKRYGFTPKEWNKAKEQYVTSKLSRDPDTFSSVTGDYQGHFLEGNAVPGRAYMHTMRKQLLAEISLAEMNAAAKKWAAETNRDIIVLAPEKEKASLPDEPAVNAWLAEIKKAKLSPYVYADLEEILARPLMSKTAIARLPVPAISAIKQTEIKEIGVTQWTLPNGIKVLLKPLKSDKWEVGKIEVAGVKPGGTDQYPDEEFVQAYLATQFVKAGGLGPYDGKYLDKFQEKRGIRIGSILNERDAKISGSVKKAADLETLFQGIYLGFTQPKKNSAGLDKLIADQKKTIIEAEERAKQSNYYNAIAQASQITRAHLITVESVEKADADKMFRIYQENYGHAADFTFIVTGDFEPEAIRPLVTRYLGALPAGTSKEKPVADFSSYRLPAKIDTTVYSESKEDRGEVQLIFKGKYAYTLANYIKTDVLAKMLHIVALERLRRKEGLCYTPGGSGMLTEDFGGVYTFGMRADCAAGKVEYAIYCILDELNRLKEKGPDEELLQKAKIQAKEFFDQYFAQGYFWQSYLCNKVKNGKDWAEVAEYPALLNSITTAMIQDMVKECLTEKNYWRFVKKPESFKVASK